MSYHVLVKNKFTVAAIEVIAEDWSTSCPALTFLKKSFDDANTMSSCKGYRALFELLAQQGPAGLTSSMMHEVNKNNAIMELIKGRLRLLFFVEKDIIYLTNGYLKSTQKADAAEVAKAVKAKNDHQKK